jgi:ABC-type lipoprotein export system ATPase subunit
MDEVDAVGGRLGPMSGPAGDTPLVRASSLSKTYGRGDASVRALEDASFEIRAGDRVAIMGPSGSGKSTLIHLMAALDRPTSGTIEWPALGRPDRLRPGPVSLSFQGPSLLPPLTVLENVELPMLLAGSREDESRISALGLIERLDLAAVADKLPEELSGGQSQRAGVARALVGRPRLVLADEPTGQQDRTSGQHLLKVILDVVGGSGAAVVIATHDHAVAEMLEQRWSVSGRRLKTGVRACSA